MNRPIHWIVILWYTFPLLMACVIFVVYFMTNH